MGSAKYVSRIGGRAMVQELPEVPQLQSDQSVHSIREVGRDLVRSMAMPTDGIAGWDDCADCDTFVRLEEIQRGIWMTAELHDKTVEEITERVKKAHHRAHTRGMVRSD